MNTLGAKIVGFEESLLFLVSASLYNHAQTVSGILINEFEFSTKEHNLLLYIRQMQCEYKNFIMALNRNFTYHLDPHLDFNFQLPLEKCFLYFR